MKQQTTQLHLSSLQPTTKNEQYNHNHNQQRLTDDQYNQEKTTNNLQPTTLLT
jgi:hypothetical protein